MADQLVTDAVNIGLLVFHKHPDSDIQTALCMPDFHKRGTESLWNVSGEDMMRAALAMTFCKGWPVLKETRRAITWSCATIP